MDLQTLAARTGVPIRRLRHCLDAELLPGLKIEVAEHQLGRPRKFADDVGFFVACAAALIGSGVDQTTVRIFIRGLTMVTLKGDKTPAINVFFARQARGRAELGDHQNMRLWLETAGEEEDTGWQHPGNRAELKPEYQPRVVIRLDIGAIGKEVFQWEQPGQPPAERPPVTVDKPIRSAYK